MDKFINKKKLLNELHLIEGEDFVYNENAIHTEYQIKEENQSSLSIKILSVLGGLLATLSFIGFLFITGLFNSELGLLILGGAFLFFTIIINKESNKITIDTASIVTYIIGIVLLSIGLKEMEFTENNILILVSIIGMGTLFITQNYMLSFVAILTINGSFLILIAFNKIPNLIHLYISFNTLIATYLFLNESRLISKNIKISKLYNPSRIGFIFSLLMGLIATIKSFFTHHISQGYLWLSSIIISSCILYVLFLLLKILEVNSLKSKFLIYTLSLLLLLPIFYSPSILGAILIILLSFLVNYKTGFVIGVVAFIYFISQYYYDLHFTLLTKSIILFSSGIVFLLLYILTAKQLNSNEEV